MASASPLPAFAPSAFDAAPAPARAELDPLDGDRIDFDCWLLPPEEIGPAERIVRALSWAAGPAAALAAGAGAFLILF